MAEKVSLQQQQREFAEMLRSCHPAASLSHIEGRRLKIYRDLFFNNVESILANGFPVLKKVLGEVNWEKLVEEFWSKHRCRTPYFPKLGGELVQWLQQKKPEMLQVYPFMLELAHYELMEVVVDTADITLPDLNGSPENLRTESTLIMNPVSVLLHYDYPVQRISADFQPSQPCVDKTRLLVYRKRNHQVKFMELSFASVVLLDLLKTQSRTLAELVTATEQSLNAASNSLSSHIVQQIRDFIEIEVIFI